LVSGSPSNFFVLFYTFFRPPIGGAFAFGFWGIHFAYPHLRLDIAERMLLGLVFGTIVFFADLYFLVKGMDQDGKLI
jgi:hypothetical protein